MQLRRHETQCVQVDSTDPATAFTSGPYGHGSRVFAKVRCSFLTASKSHVINASFEVQPVLFGLCVDTATHILPSRPLPCGQIRFLKLWKRFLTAVPCHTFVPEYRIAVITAVPAAGF